MTLRHALDDLLAILLQVALAFPGRHRAPQFVGLARGEAGRDDGDLHHLFLEDRDAERAFERGFQIVLQVTHILLILAPLQVRMHGAALDGSWSHDRDLDHKIVVILRPQPRNIDICARDSIWNTPTVSAFEIMS